MVDAARAVFEEADQLSAGHALVPAIVAVDVRTNVRLREPQAVERPIHHDKRRMVVRVDDISPFFYRLDGSVERIGAEFVHCPADHFGAVRVAACSERHVVAAAKALRVHIGETVDIDGVKGLDGVALEAQLAQPLVLDIKRMDSNSQASLAVDAIDGIECAQTGSNRFLDTEGEHVTVARVHLLAREHGDAVLLSPPLCLLVAFHGVVVSDRNSVQAFACRSGDDISRSRHAVIYHLYSTRVVSVTMNLKEHTTTIAFFQPADLNSYQTG